MAGHSFTWADTTITANHHYPHFGLCSVSLRALSKAWAGEAGVIERGCLVTESNSRYRFEWAIILSLGIVVLAMAWLYRNFVQDDAFITYRYARNLANGYGFVYNFNEPLLGTTTPLYTLVLALLARLSGKDISEISYLLSVFSLWLSGVILYDIGKKNGLILAAAVALVYVSNPLLITAIGMETFFLIAILLLALKSYLAGKLNLTGLLLGLLILTRYETVLFAGILGVHFLVRRKRLPVWLASTTVIVTAWLIFAWYSFGHVIPRSAVAKMTVLTAGDGYPFALGAVIWWRIYGLHNGWYYALVPLALFGGYAAFRYQRYQEGYILILVWTGIYFGGASVVAGSFSWYYGPLMPGLSILLVGGIDFLTSFLAALAKRTYAQYSWQGLQNGIFVIVGMSLVTLQLSSWTQGWINYQGQIADVRYVVYREVAEWLNRHASTEASLATEEIGVLGYYTEWRIVDLRGLVTPGLLPWLAYGRVATLRKATELYSPNYVLTNEKMLIDALQDSADYQPVRSFGEEAYILFRRW
jgi:hypothetical protein